MARDAARRRVQLVYHLVRNGAGRATRLAHQASPPAGGRGGARILVDQAPPGEWGYREDRQTPRRGEPDRHTARRGGFMRTALPNGQRVKRATQEMLHLTGRRSRYRRPTPTGGMTGGGCSMIVGRTRSFVNGVGVRASHKAASDDLRNTSGLDGDPVVGRVGAGGASHAGPLVYGGSAASAEAVRLCVERGGHGRAALSWHLPARP